MVFGFEPGSDRRLRALIRRALKKFDPLRVLGGPKLDYETVVEPMSLRLTQFLPRKPTSAQAALIVWAILRDADAGVPPYDEAAFRPVGDLIVKGWNDCWLVGGIPQL